MVDLPACARPHSLLGQQHQAASREASHRSDRQSLDKQTDR